MKYLLSLLVCLLLPLAYADEIRIAMEGKYPPFEELDTKGQLHGFNVEIAKALCAEMQAKCIISHVDWNELIPDLRNNKIDAVLASMPITEDRLKLVDFTDKYTQTPASFFARDHRFPYAYLDARRLAKARIGVVSDSVNDNYITAKFGSTSTIVHFKSPAEMYQALVNNNIDLFFDDLVSGNRNFVQMPMGAGFNFIGRTRDRF